MTRRQALTEWSKLPLRHIHDENGIALCGEPMPDTDEKKTRPCKDCERIDQALYDGEGR